MLKLMVGDVDRTGFLMVNSLSISQAVNERSVTNLSLVTEVGGYRPTVGEVVEIYESELLIFAGTIDDIPEQIIEGTNLIQFPNIPIVDFHQTLDRKLVADAFENETAGNIVQFLLTNYLDGEGITAGDIQQGVNVTKAVFNYIPMSQCMDELCELTGFQWVVNPDKTLDFFNRATFTGGTVTEQSQIRRISVHKSREQYRNRQYLRAGQDISLPQSRSFRGDGDTQTFTVDLPMAKVPTVTVDGVPKTVGIRGLEEGMEWYWQKNDKTISQENEDIPLTTSQVLEVVYQGYYPIMVVVDEMSEHGDRQSVEGGSGVYESIEEKMSIDTRDSAVEYANGLLRRFGTIQKKVSFESLEPFQAGQLVTVEFPSFNINEQMLVSSVQIADRGASEELVYTVSLVSGEAFGGWVNFFKKLVEQNKTFLIRENEIVIKMSRYQTTIIVHNLSDIVYYGLHQYLVCDVDQMCGEGVLV